MISINGWLTSDMTVISVGVWRPATFLKVNLAWSNG